MLDLFVDLGWKSALIAGLALLANQLLRRRPAGERVALLRAALTALLLLPLLALAGPELELALLPAIEAAPAALAVPDMHGAGAVVAEPAAPFDWLLALYAAGAGLLLLRLAFGLATLWRWTRAGAPARDPRWIAAMRAARLKRPVRLLVSPAVVAPMSWGLSPAWVLIGPATERQAGQAEAVIAHELAHVRRFDWPVLIAARLAVLCLWFNPLVWLLARELSRQTELAADAEAIGQVGRADYAQTLLALAGGAAHPAACGMSIGHSALGRRICCVLDAGAARPASRLACVAMLVGTPLAAAPLAAMQLVPAPAPAPRATIAPVPAPAIALPRIIPAARAGEEPPPQRPLRAARRAAPSRQPVAAGATPAAPVTPAPARRELQRHAGHTPPASTAPTPTPPAPGSEAAAWREALTPNIRPPAPPRPRAVAMRRQGTQFTVGREERDLAGSMAEAAKGLRLRAQELERVAADGNVAPEIRGAHARAAGALRNQAEKLDLQARRKLSGA